MGYLSRPKTRPAIVDVDIGTREALVKDSAAEGFNVSDRLAFLEIDAKTSDLLVGLRAVLTNEIGEMLGVFYGKLVQVPSLRALFPGNRAEHAKAAQSQHWLDGVFTGRFDQAYMNRVERIGQAHERIGLEPRWYMAGYCWVLNRLIDLIVAKNRYSPARMAEATFPAGIFDPTSLRRSDSNRI